MGRRPASLLSFITVVFWVATAVRVLRTWGAQLHHAQGLETLAVLTARDLVLSGVPWLVGAWCVAGAASRLARNPRGLAALTVSLPLLVAFAIGVPDLNDALRPHLGRWPRGAVLAAIAIACGVLGLGASRVAGRGFTGPVARLDRARRKLRTRPGLREVFHPAVGVAGAALVAAAVLVPSWIAPEPKPRSVVIISIDTLRADHLGVYGYPRETSPNIDAWAATAVVFESAISQASWTKPSVASLFTSLYPSVHQTGSGTRERRRVTNGELHMVDAPEDAPSTVPTMPPSLITVAEVFRNAGYRTLGLLANNLIGKEDGYGQGFETYENFGDRAIAARAVEWLRRHEGEPVFVYLHFMAPHAPYDPPAAYDLFTDGVPHIDIHHTASKDSINFTRTKVLNERDVEVLVNQYDGEIRFADDLVGQVLDVLSEPPWRETTLVALTSDHGEEFMDHGMVWHEPTRFYQELTRVPLIVSGPGTSPNRVAEPVMTIDLAPTCMTFGGLDVPDIMQGRSYLPLLTGGTMPARAVYAEALDWGVGQAVWRGTDKLHYDHEAPALHLFDLATDLGERIDRLALEPELRAALVDSLGRRWTANATLRSHFGVGSVTLTEDQRERLRSLGYAQ